MRLVEVKAMTQESALTREEIEALDDQFETLGFEPEPGSDDVDARFDVRAVRAQQPEDRS
jgi:hypothetical protein